jgi:oligopeptidase B
MPSPFPIAPKRPHPITQHGQTRVDDYFWLRYRDDPETLAYLKAENDYLDEMMQHTKPLQEQLYAEMRARLKETDASAPEKHGPYYYYSRTEAGKQYPIYCRKHGALDAPEEILLDQNALAAGKSFCRLGAFVVSPDHRWLAYSIDGDGAEVCTLYVKDLQTGALLPEQIPNTAGDVYEHGGVAWANDSRTFFYVTLDHAHRPYRLHRHTLGADPAQDALVYHEADESYFLFTYKTKSERYILIHLYATSTTEIRFAPADQPEAGFRVIHPRQHGLEYRVAHHGERFLIVTNENAQNFKLMEAPVATPSKEHWREIIPHRADVLIDGVEAFRDHLALYERQGGLRQIRLSAPDGVSNVRYVAFPEPVYTFTTGENPEFDSPTLRFTYTSLVTPNSVIDYNMADGQWEVKKVDEIPSGYEAGRFVTERLHATAPDGARVPMSIVYKKGLPRDGRNPALLYGYGSYGANVEPSFNANRLSLLERGFVFAMAHIRGGSEMGRAWYENGKLLHKRNTFSDFIAGAEHLIAQGYTSREKLSIMGVSAGGLLVGAATTMRPDLFKAVVAKVPFVDVVNSMNDPSIPLTVIEWEQWGNPEKREYFDYMLSYSPYDNVRAAAYPHLLLTAGLNDPRVAYWEPAKFAARLRALKTDDHLLLLKTNLDAGHAGASGRYDNLKEIAFEFAFLIDRLGVDWNAK